MAPKNTTDALAKFQTSLLGWMSGQLTWGEIPNATEYMHLLENASDMSIGDAIKLAEERLGPNAPTLQVTDTARYIMAAQYFLDKSIKDPRLGTLYTAAIHLGKQNGVISVSTDGGITSAVYDASNATTATTTGGGKGDGTATVALAGGGTVTGPDVNQDGIPDDLAQILAGGGDGTDQKAHHQAVLNATATFTQTLGYWGLNVDSSLQGIIDQAAQHGWGNDRFLQAVSDTSAFQERFKGIFDPQSGEMKMTPQQYLQQEKAYQTYAAQYGINLNGGKEAYLFRNDVSPQVAAQRFQTEATLRDNKDFFAAYNQELKAEGKAPLDHDGLFKLVQGEGNKEYTQLLERAQTRYAGEQAGIHFGNAAQAYLNISERQVKRIGGKDLSPEALQANFEAAASDLLTTLPLSRIQKYGLKKNDILQARFGGKKQADVLQLMQHIQDQEKAFYADRASAQIYADGSGQVQTLGGAGSKAAQ